VLAIYTPIYLNTFVWKLQHAKEDVITSRGRDVALSVGCPPSGSEAAHIVAGAEIIFSSFMAGMMDIYSDPPFG